MNVHPEKCIDNRGEEYLKSTFLDIAHALGCDTVSEAISLFRSMLDEMGISQPTSREREKELDILSSSVNPIRLKNNPVELDGESIQNLYVKVIADS